MTNPQDPVAHKMMTNWRWFLIQLKHWKHDWSEPHLHPYDANALEKTCMYKYCSARMEYHNHKGYWEKYSW